MDAKKWLELACNKRNNRHPEFATPQGNISVDGFRIHRDNSLPSVKSEITDMWSTFIPSRPRNRATITRQDLIDACKRAMALRTDRDRRLGWEPTLIVSMNGRFSYSAKAEETGTIAAEVIDGEKVSQGIKSLKNKTVVQSRTMVYKHTGDKEVTFGIRPAFLLDALAGMEGDTVEIDIPAHNAPFYMTDGTREAVIMPICIR